jgi:hypothetical protein
LLQYFRDQRYIKEGNKPLLIIYKPYLIKNLEVMMKLWNQLSIEAGFNGIYWCVQHTDNFLYEDVIKKFDLIIEFEPSYTANHEMKISKMNQSGLIKMSTPLRIRIKRALFKIFHKLCKIPDIISYDDTWKLINNREPIYTNTAAGAFVSWDNTPRKGKAGLVYHKATPQKFKKYMSKRFLRASEVYQSEYLFINAWNEWAEGAHLEPDERNQYGYLKALKEAKMM